MPLGAARTLSPASTRPVQRRHRGDDMGGIGALLAARPDQARGRQPGQQRVQHHLLQARIGPGQDIPDGGPDNPV